MLAIQGIYDNGQFIMEKKPPINKGKIIVIFLDTPEIEDKSSTDEASQTFVCDVTWDS